jgi:hypothetical protein
MADDLIRTGSPPSSTGGSGVTQKMGGLPVWAWVAIAAAGGIVFFVWRSKSSSTTASTADTSTDNSDAEANSLSQLAVLESQIRDIQGDVSTSQSGDTTTATLTAPAGLKASRVDQGGVSLTWTAVSGAKGYRTYVNGVQAGNTVVFANAYVYLPKRKTKYTVGVAAIDSTNKVGPTASISVTTK